MKLNIMVGLPGSGKSTWLTNNVKENEVVVSRDEIRFSMLGESYFTNEKRVYRQYIDTIVKNLKEGKTVFADATHISKNSRNQLLNCISQHIPLKDISINIYLIVPNMPKAIQQNHNRSDIRLVPDNVIKEMFERYTPPSEDKYKYQNIYIIS